MQAQDKYIFTGQELIDALIDNLRGRGIPYNGGTIRLKSLDKAMSPKDPAIELYIDREVQ